MEQLKTFDEFIAESKSSTINTRINEMAISCVFEAETGEVTVSVNESFVKDLQLHIRKTIDFLAEKGIKGTAVNKVLDRNLIALVQSYKDGDSPEKTAEMLAK